MQINRIAFVERTRFCDANTLKRIQSVQAFLSKFAIFFANFDRMKCTVVQNNVRTEHCADLDRNNNTVSVKQSAWHQY